jgi:hypothetical protein
MIIAFYHNGSSYSRCFLQSTVDVSKGLPLEGLMSTLTVGGRLIMVALPDDDLPSINAFRKWP